MTIDQRVEFPMQSIESHDRQTPETFQPLVKADKRG